MKCSCFESPYDMPMSCGVQTDIMRNADKLLSCDKCLKLSSKYDNSNFTQEKVVTCCCFEEGVDEMFNYGKREYKRCGCFCSKTKGYTSDTKYNITTFCCSQCIETSQNGIGFYLCCVGYYVDMVRKLWRCCCFECACSNNDYNNSDLA